MQKLQTLKEDGGKAAVKAVLPGRQTEKQETLKSI